MTPDFIPHVMTAVEIAGIIAVEIEHDSSLADNVRTAAWYVVEIDSTMTPARFGEGAVLIGLHAQGSSNRYREAMRNLAEAAS